MANSKQMRMLGAFLPHHERRNLEEPIVYQSQFCGSRVKISFYNIINHCLSELKGHSPFIGSVIIDVLISTKISFAEENKAQSTITKLRQHATRDFCRKKK